MNKFKPEIEYQSKEVIKHYQEERLGDALMYLKGNSLYYQKLFNKNKIDITKIRTIEDLKVIPPTEKKIYNYLIQILFVFPKIK
jgi:Coenzyme F390 synthetase